MSSTWHRSWKHSGVAVRASAVAFAVVAVAVTFGGWKAKAQTARPATPASAGFYGEEQARRGKAEFAKACAACHTVDATKAAAPVRPSTPVTAGGVHVVMMPLAGSDVIQKWRTVGDLFSKVRRTMPANNANGLGDDTYLDIVAYMLQANGFAAGRTLTPDVAALHRLVIAKVNGNDVGVTNLASGRFYTAAQAARGKVYFQGNCMTCHTTNPDGKPTEAEAATGHEGGLLAPNWNPFPIGRNMQRWGSVFNLYNKIHQTMPGHDPGGLSVGTALDIAAYFMENGGVPPGTEELKYNVNALKSMMLNEPGFEKVFNGKDLTGLNFVIGARNLLRPQGGAQSGPAGAVKVEDGTLVSFGTPEGYWYLPKKYLNFTLRFDYRYFPVPGLEDEDFLGNSGVMIFFNTLGVYPKMIEIQGQHQGVGQGIGVSAKITVKNDNDARRRIMKPVGAWNTMEVASKAGQVVTLVNGAVISTISEHEFKEPGYIGFQIEGGKIQWRNIRIKEE